MPVLLQLNSALNYGSTGKIAEDIALTAINNGWNCYIAHGARHVNNSKINSKQINTILDTYIHGGFYSLLLDRNGLGSIQTTKKLIGYIDSCIKPDIIHLHNIHGYYVNYRVLFEYLQHSHAQVVWTLHDCWSFTGHCAHFDLIGCNKWKSECHDCPQSRNYPSSLFIDNSRNNYELKKRLFTSIKDRLTIIPVSEWLSNLVKESFLKDCRINVIHNGIDIQCFSPSDTRYIITRNKLEGKRIIIGVASIWSDRKGLKDFIKLRDVLPSQYAIVLIGLSDKQIKNLPQGIIGIKRTQNTQELAEWYSAADVFVNPTYEDNYPTVNLEAMACGTPVITYNTGGSPEAITPDTGITVGKGDIRAIVDAIHKIENSDIDYHKTCRNRALKYFNKQTCFNKYIDLYNNLLKI